ncbi:MAG: MOSC domain-containing protein [Syntrophomonadaceae bacterium]|jgi:MOSC domain-containing protein YiiM|nr:MOSC domain-containing protein [Syntrophomonadaceae bacterium]
MKGRVLAVCTSEDKGEKKRDIGQGLLIADHGLEGDAHAGSWHRQVSLLSLSSINKMRKMGLEIGFGDFAENLAVEGLDVGLLPVGTRLRVGAEAELEITQIGKECHMGCAIRRQVGDCVMPREGVFARVLQGGPVRAGDLIEVKGA